MVQANASDDDLLNLFRKEETKEQAFTAIVARYKERLYWHIRRLVVVHDDADDVLQNVFIKAWKGLSNFNQESKLFTWLYRIATNESLTHLDKLKRMRVSIGQSADAGLEDQVKADEYFDPSKLEWKLQMAIQSLPAQQRVVFSLRYFDEMPYKEMSTILNVTEGALKASYHHAAKKIEAWILNN